VHDKEMMGIIRALEAWRQPPRRSENTEWRYGQIIGICNILCHQRSLNRRQARWALYLSRFDFENDLISQGSAMGKADALSRRARS